MLKLVVIGIMLSFNTTLLAQVSVNVNVGMPPQWGPVGYTDARYYYLPDIETYYDIHSSKFIYFNGGKWIYRNYPPRQYRSYDLYGGYKVVMTDYHGNTPYIHFKEYKTKYARGYHGPAQKTIGNRQGNGNIKAKIHYNVNSKKILNHGNNRIGGNDYNKNINKGRAKSGGKSKRK